MIVFDFVDAHKEWTLDWSDCSCGRVDPCAHMAAVFFQLQEQRDLCESIRLAMHQKVKAEVDRKGMSRAHIVIHDDPWWNPAVEAQATDRAHRIGQDKPVCVYKMITPGNRGRKNPQITRAQKGTGRRPAQPTIRENPEAHIRRP